MENTVELTMVDELATELEVDKITELEVELGVELVVGGDELDVEEEVVKLVVAATLDVEVVNSALDVLVKS